MRPTHVETHAQKWTQSSTAPFCMRAPRWEPVCVSPSFPSVPVLGRPQGWGMCESHVSNPQTVGKCCSLLNSLLPPSVPLHASLRCSPSLLSTLQASALPHSNPVQVFACVFERVYVRACPAAHRKWVKSGCQRHGIAASCKQCPCQQQADIHTGNRLNSSWGTAKMSKDWGRLLLHSSFCGCLSLHRVSLALHRLLPLEHKHWHLSQCVHCVHPFEDKELLSGFLCCLPKTTK